MIYRRPIRDVVEERRGRMFGVHVFVCYGVALAAVLGMSSACLAATRTGYFSYLQEEKHWVRGGDDDDDVMVSYDITYGWRFMCSRVDATYRNHGLVSEQGYDDCFGLDEMVTLPLDSEVLWAAGSSMTADTGLAVALGHAVAAAVALTHVVFFVLLFLNIEPVPVRGYLYMRGLGLMSALASFYLIFTGVVSFFFGVKDSLDSSLTSSSGLKPSWAYILTVVDVALMMVVAMRACHDDEVDVAIATPQYTSSSRDEDTVKRASGKLLHLRSRSSDTILEGSATNLPTSAPKATVGGVGSSNGYSHGHGNGLDLGAGGQVPPVSVSSVSLSLLGGPRRSGSSSTTTAAAAAGAGGAAEADGAAPSPVPSGSVRSSWTGRVSLFSPPSRRRGDDEGFGDGDGDGDVAEQGVIGGRGRRGEAERGEVVTDLVSAGAGLFMLGRDDAETAGGGVESPSSSAAATNGHVVAEDDREVWKRRQQHQQQQHQQEEGEVLEKEQEDEGALASAGLCSEEDVRDIERGGARVGVSPGAGLEGQGLGGAEEAPREEKEASLIFGDSSSGDGQSDAAALPRRGVAATDSAPSEETLAEFSTARTDVSVVSDDPEAAGAGAGAGMWEGAPSRAVAPGDEAV